MKIRICSLVVFLTLLSNKIAIAQDLSTNVLYKVIAPSGMVLDTRDATDNASTVYLGKNIKDKKSQHLCRFAGTIFFLNCQKR